MLAQSPLCKVSVHSGIARAVAGGDTALLHELRALRTRIAELETLNGMRAAALFPLRMRPQARVIFGLLLAREAVSGEALVAALYVGLPECDWPRDPARNLTQQLHHLRKLIAPHGAEIETHLGAPSEPTIYRLPPKTKAWARALIAARGGKVMA